jgi:hypothetical protein
MRRWKVFFDTRWRQVKEGDRRGVIGEVKEILELHEGKEANEVWEAVGRASKGKFKRLVRRFGEEMEENMWMVWRDENWTKESSQCLLKERRGKEEYVGLEKRKRSMVAGVRLGVTNALGDKGNKGGLCRLCGDGEETGMHWVAECKMFEGKRMKVCDEKGLEVQN